MKILHVSSSGALLGGAEYALLELVEFELRAGHEPVVLVPGGGELVDRLGLMNIQVVRIPYFPSLESTSEGLAVRLAKRTIKTVVNYVADLCFARLVAWLSPTVIHMNTSAVSIGARNPRRSDPPRVWHVREIGGSANGRASWNADRMFRKILESDAVICVSDATIAHISGAHDQSHVQVVYDDVPCEKFPDRQRPILSDSVCRMAVIGPVTPSKGQRIALDALLLLRRKGVHNLTLSFIGRVPEGPYGAGIASAVRAASASSIVKFVGTFDDVIPELANFDMLLVCSRSESFGRATIEAMYAGALVIGADNTCTHELLVNGAGYLFSGTAEALAQSIQLALNNVESSRDVAHEAKLHAIKKYGSDRARSEIVGIFEKVAFRED